MAELGKFEGMLQVGTTALALSLAENGGGSSSVTVLSASTNYWPTSTTSFLTAIGTALTASASHAGTYTLTVSDSDSGTGRVTISATGVASFAITWSNTTLRDALGFDGNVSGSASYTGTNACPYVWLPNQKRSSPPVPEGYTGVPIRDTSITVAPSGYSKSLYYSTRYANQFTFRFLSGNKTWDALESVGNESWETFSNTTAGKGIPVRWHYDRDDDATSKSYVLMPQWEVVPEIDGFTGKGSTGSSTYWALKLNAIQYLE